MSSNHKEFMEHSGFRFDETRRYWINGMMALNDEAAKWFYSQAGQGDE